MILSTRGFHLNASMQGQVPARLRAEIGKF